VTQDVYDYEWLERQKEHEVDARWIVIPSPPRSTRTGMMWLTSMSIRHTCAIISSRTKQQTETAAFGMWLFLLTEIMFFGGLFTAYIDLPQLVTSRRLWRGRIS